MRILGCVPGSNGAIQRVALDSDAGCTRTIASVVLVCRGLRVCARQVVQPRGPTLRGREAKRVPESTLRREGLPSAVLTRIILYSFPAIFPQSNA